MSFDLPTGVVPILMLVVGLISSVAPIVIGGLILVWILRRLGWWPAPK